jgi:hypothetical protein
MPNDHKTPKYHEIGIPNGRKIYPMGRKINPMGHKIYPHLPMYLRPSKIFPN